MGKTNKQEGAKVKAQETNIDAETSIFSHTGIP